MLLVSEGNIQMVTYWNKVTYPQGQLSNYKKHKSSQSENAHGIVRLKLN